MTPNKLYDLIGDVNPLDVLDFDPMIVLLQNGDLILTELAAIDDTNYCMLAPFRLFESQSPLGEVRMAAVRLIPGSDDLFYHLSTSNVISSGSMSRMMFEFYQKNVDKVIAADMVVHGGNEVAAVAEPTETPHEGNVYQFPTKTVH